MSLDQDGFRLKDVEIADADDDESSIVADSTDSVVSLSMILSIILPIIVIAGSCFVPEKNMLISQTVLISNVTGTTSHQIEGTIAKLKPISRELTLGIRFANISGSTIAISGGFGITATREDMLVHDLQESIQKVTLAVNSNGVSDDLKLFHVDVLNFDTLKTSVLLKLPFTGKEQLIFEWNIVNPTYTIVIGITRLVFAFSILPALISYFRKINKKTDTPISVESKLTMILSGVTVLCIDPFDVMNDYNPSFGNKIRHVIFRDIFYAFMIFYCLGIFGYFDKNRTLSLLFPGVISVSIFAILLIKDVIAQPTNQACVLPVGKPEQYDAHSNLHVAIFGVVFVALIIRVAIIFSSKIQESKSGRYINYTASVLGYMFVIVVYTAVDLYTSFVKTYSVPDMVTMAIFISFCFMMEYMHTETDDFENDPYAQTLDGDAGDALGADEDSDEIGKVVKKGADI